MVPGEGIRQLITPPNGNAAKKNTKRKKTQWKVNHLLLLKTELDNILLPITPANGPPAIVQSELHTNLKHKYKYGEITIFCEMWLKSQNICDGQLRGDMKPVSGILKRPPVEPELALPVRKRFPHQKIIQRFPLLIQIFILEYFQDSETNEEESAYNEHFKHTELRPGTGVRPSHWNI